MNENIVIKIGGSLLFTDNNKAKADKIAVRFKFIVKKIEEPLDFFI